MRDVEVQIEGVVDPAKERAKLEKQREQLGQRVAASEKRLSNEGFLAKAGEQVVQKENMALDELKKQLLSVEKRLEELR